MICNCYFERSYWRWSWWSYKENIILGAVLFLPLTWLHTSGCRLYVYRLIDHPACLGVKGECRVPVLWCYLSVFDSGPPADSGCPQKCRCRCAASPPLVTASDSGWSCSCWLPVCSAYNCSIWKWRGTWIKKKRGWKGRGILYQWDNKPSKILLPGQQTKRSPPFLPNSFLVWITLWEIVSAC